MPGPVVVDIGGLYLNDADRKRLCHPLVGMVVLFSRNFDSTAQLARLCREIHALRDPPLLIAVDHEGGRVQRFRAGFTQIPPMAALGRLWDRDVLAACRAALAAGFILGAELRAHGVDMTFAPVLDLDWGKSAVIGDRAFHADHRVVTLLANQVGYGLALAGMSNCGKHFPGHGWVYADSHYDVSTDERGLEDILRTDAAPYAWMGVGLDAVMPAHVVYPCVDVLPAGFSARWIQEILRERLGFCGAVLSDDLSMQGARVAGDVVQCAQAALAAGCDFVLVCNDEAAADRVLDQLRWVRTAQFTERAARLVPRTGAVLPESLVHSDRYRAALRDLQSAFGLDPGPGGGEYPASRPA
ncbi:Beta-hexosaminidase [Burkholderiales bacterium]|jgi:beta-N-acetylhexosaminidase|nr:Beta-hexosaminidase [Burkholderiales bacterium]